MKRPFSILTLFLLVLFVFSFSHCRSLTGQRETRSEKNIRYQQKKIEDEREKNGTTKMPSEII